MERKKIDALHIVEYTIEEIIEAYKIGKVSSPFRSSQVVLLWFWEFRDNGRQFLVHLIMNELSSKQKLNLFLELHHKLKDAIIEYGLENFDNFSITMMKKFINKYIFIIVQKEK